MLLSALLFGSTGVSGSEGVVFGVISGITSGLTVGVCILLSGEIVPEILFDGSFSDGVFGIEISESPTVSAVFTEVFRMFGTFISNSGAAEKIPTGRQSLRMTIVHTMYLHFDVNFLPNNLKNRRINVIRTLIETVSSSNCSIKFVISRSPFDAELLTFRFENACKLS